MARIRMLARRIVWAPHDHIGTGGSPDVEWLETLESLTPQPARPPLAPGALAGARGLKLNELGPRPRALQHGAAGQPTPPRRATEHLGPEDPEH